MSCVYRIAGPFRLAGGLSLVLLLTAGAEVFSAAQAAPANTEAETLQWMSDRKQVQMKALQSLQAFHDFQLTDGLGATVKVYADQRIWTRYNDGKSGYLSQSSIPLYFCLVEALSVEKMEVRWPSGKTQAVPGPISPNQSYTVTEEN
jgi:hypothetical protein